MVKNMTINYGSIMQMFCVGYTDTLTMSVPLQALKPLCADQLNRYVITYEVPFYGDIDRINNP